MSNSINTGVARLSLVDDDDDGGVRLLRPATPRVVGSHADSTHQEAERSCLSSAATSVAAPSMSRQDLALAALSQSSNADNNTARQAIADNRFFARDGTRLNPGWTIHDSNLGCKHTGPWRDFRGQRVSPPELVSHDNLFGQEGVLLCEDGRSGARCRVWWSWVLHCHKCDTYICKQCHEEHQRSEVNAKHRLGSARQRRDAKRTHKRETWNMVQKFSAQKLS
ncbi:hypothetical protein KCU99_g8014, partial [Aureobasidium melanogenum]